MRIITVINQKGGVGKSTTALSIGAGLILKGQKVLFIDLDAQGNLSCSLKADTQGYGSMGAIERPETIRDEIQTTDEGDVLASSPRLAGAEKILEDLGREYKLREAVSYLKGLYDYVIIDTPPSLGVLTINALTASTEAIIPAQADLYSLQGISQLKGTIDTVKRYCNPDLKILGIVLTRYNGRSVISRDLTEMISNTAQQLDTKLFEAKIRECTAIKEAQAVRQNIFKYSPKCNASADYKALVDEILKGDK